MSKFLALARALLAPLLPQARNSQQAPTIDSYGQATCSIPMDEIQSVMTWLFASLLNAEYYSKSHIIWYNDAVPNPELEKVVREGIKHDEPTFLYRCGSKVQPPPNGYYWRLMAEHSSNRVYQLEVKEGD